MEVGSAILSALFFIATLLILKLSRLWHISNDYFQKEILEELEKIKIITMIKVIMIMILLIVIVIIMIKISRITTTVTAKLISSLPGEI